MLLNAVRVFSLCIICALFHCTVASAPSGHCPGVSGRSRRSPRYFQAIDRDQHHRYAAGQRDRGHGGHAEALPRCRVCARRRETARPRPSQAEPGRANSRRASHRRSPSSFIATWTWCKRCAPTGNRSVSIRGEGRLFLRPRHAGHEGPTPPWSPTFVRFKQEGYKPERDLILALTADEEGGKFNGAEWLVKNHRDLVDAA